jgi:hypothetical protein
MPDQDLDFFISYTGRDAAWATWVAQRLELAGYRTVLQAWDFRDGNFLAQMERAVQGAKRLIPILSEPYLGSKWSREEWTAVMRIGRPIIPVQIEEINTPSLLGTRLRINLIGLGEQAAEQKLLKEIKKQAGDPDPRNGPLDRQNGMRVTFPEESYPASAGSADEQEHSEAASPTVPVDPDHIQLVLMGAGEAARATVAFFRDKLGTPPGRCLDLFESPLPADKQLGQLAALVQNVDPDAVSDLLVVFAGTGSRDADAGVQLHVQATEADRPTTAVDLKDLLEPLQDRPHRRVRSYLVLDVTDTEGQPVGPTKPDQVVPVLRLGGSGGSGVARIREALDSSPEELAGKLRHWGPLSLLSLRMLGGGELIAEPDSAAHHVGLIPSPLAWPRDGSADGGLGNWCAVLSERDTGRSDWESIARVVDRLARQGLDDINWEYGKQRDGIVLDEAPGWLRAADLLSSPRSFAHAVEQVCRADLAIFDLTNFEPAVMILLGVRAVIRRGLTVCVARDHDPLWHDAEPPFHLREVSLIKRPDWAAIRDRVKEGIRQLAESGGSYRDLPCFDLIRDVPADVEQRQRRAFDGKQKPSILALVPFDSRYVERNWVAVEDGVPAAAQRQIRKRRGGADDVPQPTLQRTLDLKSPRVVSAQLFEAIRLTDFCLVDLTTARPNVLFELGVRLAANRIHPVVIDDPDYPAGKNDPKCPVGKDDPKCLAGKREAGWFQAVDRQLTMVRRLLQPVPYTVERETDWNRVVERHLEFCRLLLLPGDPRADAVLGGLPPAGVYDIAWPHAAERDEVVTTGVEDHLAAGGQALLVDRSQGQRHLIYPVGHHLTNAAERTGREYLIAAWLYLHFRIGVNNDSDPEVIGRYQALANELGNLLTDTGDQADDSFAEKIEQWRADRDGTDGQRADGEHG